MDIEGAEYEILRHMIAESIFAEGLVDEIMVEWHGATFRPDLANPSQLEHGLLQEIQARGTKVATWRI